jgi:hypothetical protein
VCIQYTLNRALCTHGQRHKQFSSMLLRCKLEQVGIYCIYIYAVYIYSYIHTSSFAHQQANLSVAAQRLHWIAHCGCLDNPTNSSVECYCAASTVATVYMHAAYLCEVYSTSLLPYTSQHACFSEVSVMWTVNTHTCTLQMSQTVW